MTWSNTTPPMYLGEEMKPKRTIISIAHKIGDEFTNQLENEIRTAAQRIGYNISILDSQNSVALQLAQVKNAREKGEQAMIIKLVDPASVAEVIKAANGMKIVFVNRPPDDLSPLNENMIYVGGDERVAGELQGKWLAEHFKQKGQKTISYVLLSGPLHLSSARERTEAVLKTLEEQGITLVPLSSPLIANYDRGQALVMMLEFLRSGARPDAIISNNDAMALGAIQALDYMNLKDDKKPIVVGVDATAPAMRAFAEGKLDMTVFQDASEQGRVSMVALMNMLNGRPTTQGVEQYVSKNNPYVLHIPFEKVTRYSIPKNLHF